MSEAHFLHVACGIVSDTSGRILIARRGNTLHNPHLWEFPGGKLEHGETPSQALSRELMEELHLLISHVHEVHTEAENGICLHFLTALAENTPVCIEHDEIRFVDAVSFGGVPLSNFSPADMLVAKMLRLQSEKPAFFLWDYDGTLMDTYPMNVLALQQVCAARGVQADGDRIYRLMMDTQAGCIHKIAEENGWNFQQLFGEFRSRFAKNYSTPSPVPGIPEALREMCRRGGRHFLITHNNMDAVKALESRGLWQYFSGCVTSEAGLPRKPDPAMVRFILEKYNLPKEKCVIIGDRHLDTASGINAGIHSCLLDRFGIFPDEACDVRVKSPEELPGCLMGWN